MFYQGHFDAPARSKSYDFEIKLPLAIVKSLQYVILIVS